MSKRKQFGFSSAIIMMLTVSFFFFHTQYAQAEGSYEINQKLGGKRFFLHTYDPLFPQQFKVYAKSGEYLNVGASHIGIKGGFIKVYTPSGILAATFEDPAGDAIINNNIEEANGPTGGGSMNGMGYKPGVIPITEEGVWTVHISYPEFVYNTDYKNFVNVDAGAPWTRAANQPTVIRRAVLAWDITVSQGGAGNADGSKLLKGRVYSNDLNMIISQNGNVGSTSLFILTRDGILYSVDFKDIDPWAFPFTTNNVGLVNAAKQPTYQSAATSGYKRTADLNDFKPGSLYFYEPQAKDTLNFINNKIFINTPSEDLPHSALVTDIFRMNTHTTWLLNNPPEGIANLSKFELVSTNPDCGKGVVDLSTGANFEFTSNISGAGSLYLDLNNDGDFIDATDVIINTAVSIGNNKIFWDGKDGQGNAIPTNAKFSFNYKFLIRSGEVHVQLFDAENNIGGTTITRLNGFEAPNSDIFYDHSSVGGEVSGGGSPGDAKPTTMPYTYMNSFGNEKILDYWSYVPYDTKVLENITVEINPDCNKKPLDSDKDGIPDIVDLDDDNDGVSDVQEFCNLGKEFSCLPNGTDPSSDDDFDGIPNYKDAINNKTGRDVGCVDGNNDGICDLILSVYDIDGDNVPDHLDLDSDNDGITDLDEAGHGQPDVDRNGVIDGLPVVFGKNGLYDPIDKDTSSLTAGSKIIPWDYDGDGVPDHDDLDSDNDGIFDLREAGYNYEFADLNNDGRIDVSTTNPVDENGLPALISPSKTGQPIGYPNDFDGDGIPDWHDLDSDNDGINDVLEGGATDLDNDGIIGVGTPTINPNGVATSDSKGNPLSSTSKPVDTDGDGIPDWHDYDSDGDGIPDVIEAGFPDPDKDGIVGTGKPNVNPKGQPTDGVTSLPPDFDKDGKPDFRDTDCNLLLDKPTLTSGGAVCPGGDINLYAQSNYPSAIKYVWFNSAGDTLATSGKSLTIKENDPKAKGPFTVMVFLNGCKSSLSDPITITYIKLPAGAVISAANDTLFVKKNVGYTHTLITNDIIPNNINWLTKVETNPTKGTVVINSNGTFTYTPNNNFIGKDEFTYSVVFQDCPNIKSTAKVIVTVYEPADTDKDGIADDVDLDDDNDGISDVQEFCNYLNGFTCLVNGADPSGDDDFDGIPNYKDAVNRRTGQLSGCIDGNQDGVCDLIAAVYDTDGDNIPDHLDLDSDNDGITDLVESGHGQPDSDGNGVIDGTPAIFGINGLYDPIDKDPTSLTAGSKIIPQDWDGDGVPDHDDLDSDNDGIYDIKEAGYGYEKADLNNDGRIDVTTINPIDVNGLPSLISPLVTGKPIGKPIDFDKDGIPDWHDLDSDNDGINDVKEAGFEDLDNDGFIGIGKPKVDTNGVATSDSKGNPLSVTNNPKDTDNDGTPDWHDYDSDGDGIPDVIEAGFSDPDKDGIIGTGTPVVNPFGQPKDTNTSNPPDFDGDGIPDFRDTECNKILEKPVLTSTGSICPEENFVLFAQSTYPSDAKFVWINALGDTLASNTNNLTINEKDAKAVSPFSALVLWKGCTSRYSDPLNVEVKKIPLGSLLQANNDTFKVAVKVPFNGDLVSNDNITTALNWAASIEQNPTNGTLTINPNGTFTYTPKEGFVGSDQFAYKLIYDECPTLNSKAIVVIQVVNDVVDNCVIPNVITTNNDGENDVLIIPCAESYTNSELTVYNRWGAQVFYAKPYNNNWGGTYNGDLLPAGTYFYTFKLKPEDKDCKVGHVTIIRQ